jgi:predicted transcriptional regulator YheO
MDQRELIFTLLKQMADAIVKTFSRSCEVAVHDLSNLSESLVYIAGDVTRRQVGAPITDMVVRALRQEGHDIKDRYCYKTTTRDGRTVKATTVFIRDAAGEVVGAFCMNFDTTDFANARLALDTFLNSDDFSGNDRGELFASTVEETIGALFEQAVSGIGKKPATMSMEEKIACVQALANKGAFLIKGSVDQVAIMLGVSKFTVYNYLQRIRAAQAVDQS